MDFENKYIDEEPATPLMNDSLILDKNFCYNCTECSCSIEVLLINDKENTLTFKCLNLIEKDNDKIQKMPINKYIDTLKKYINI